MQQQAGEYIYACTYVRKKMIFLYCMQLNPFLCLISEFQRKSELRLGSYGLFVAMCMYLYVRRTGSYVFLCLSKTDIMYKYKVNVKCECSF